MAYLDEGFYSLGLKIISPDIQSVNNVKYTTFRFTTDKSFDEIFEDLNFMELKKWRVKCLYLVLLQLQKYLMDYMNLVLLS